MGFFPTAHWPSLAPIMGFSCINIFDNVYPKSARGRAGRNA